MSASLTPGPARAWCTASTGQRLFLEAVSLLAPEAERFFIHWVRSNAPRVVDPRLRAECERFIREEGGHIRAHRQFNEGLQDGGADPELAVRPLRTLLGWSSRFLPASFNLALTAAGEHVSAMVSAAFLRNFDRAGICDAATREVYAQHAREEIGHCNVAHDLLCATTPLPYLHRVVALAGVLLVAPAIVLMTMLALSPGSRLGARVHALGAGLGWAAGEGRRLLEPATLARQCVRYLHPRFHPSQVFATASSRA